MRGDQRLTKAFIKSRIWRECTCKGSADSCPRVLRVSFSSPRFCIVLDPTLHVEVEWEALERSLGALVRNLRAMKVAFG